MIPKWSASHQFNVLRYSFEDICILLFQQIKHLLIDSELHYSLLHLHIVNTIAPELSELCAQKPFNQVIVKEHQDLLEIL